MLAICFFFTSRSSSSLSGQFSGFNSFCCLIASASLNSGASIFLACSSEALFVNMYAHLGKPTSVVTYAWQVRLEAVRSTIFFHETKTNKTWLCQAIGEALVAQKNRSEALSCFRAVFAGLSCVPLLAAHETIDDLRHCLRGLSCFLDGVRNAEAEADRGPGDFVFQLHRHEHVRQLQGA
ncbi:hypothetical protein PMI08_02326 [Brevibacillus sp. CF112]|nr:hypothetical protein PMI08_02326 [Brevibacillus sp. CF112]